MHGCALNNTIIDQDKAMEKTNKVEFFIILS